MASPKGSVLERHWKRGTTYALRFSAYGRRRYLTLGRFADGWTRPKAEEELENVLADVRRGIWIPPDRNGHGASDPEPDGPGPEPTLHRFSSQWLAGRRGEVTERTYDFYEWALSYHLLPYLANWRLSEITIEAVDAYRRFKVSQADLRRAAIERGEPLADDQGRPLRPLSPTTINKTIEVLQAVLALAVEYGHIATNPAAGKRRRLKPPAHRPVHLDTAEQIEALLDAAGDLDARAVAQTSGRRALIATLVLAGPRASEGCALLWRDVDPTGASRSGARRPWRACARSTCCRSCATSLSRTRQPRSARDQTTRSSRPRPAGHVTRTTSGTVSLRRSPSGPMRSWPSVIIRHCRKASPPTSCATPSPRCSSHAARTPPRSWPSSGIPTQSSPCASTRT